MPNSVLFIDEVAPKPYTLETLKTQALGGTEATVLRVKAGLANAGYDVEPSDPKVVVCLRDPRSLLKAREKYPKAKLYLWCHDLITKTTAEHIPTILATQAELICVSQYHRQQCIDTFVQFGFTGEFKIHYIYNPIDDTLIKDQTEYDKNKLVWFSSPHKGLDYALRLFDALLRFNPEFRLFIANPGYYHLDYGSPRQVVSLGNLPHHEAIQHVRESLCVFYPNIVFPETFGLVFAEANAVGTPVIAHSFGAANEILDHPAETFDCRCPKDVIDRTLAWQSGMRPIVHANPRFRLSKVIQDWQRLLG